MIIESRYVAGAQFKISNTTLTKLDQVFTTRKINHSNGIVSQICSFGLSRVFRTNLYNSTAKVSITLLTRNLVGRFSCGNSKSVMSLTLWADEVYLFSRHNNKSGNVYPIVF